MFCLLHESPSSSTSLLESQVDSTSPTSSSCLTKACCLNCGLKSVGVVSVITMLGSVGLFIGAASAKSAALYTGLVVGGAVGLVCGVAGLVVCLGCHVRTEGYEEVVV